jgi:hypothetical protein
MATYQKFNAFTENQLTSNIDWNADAFKVMLCNTAPVATNSVKADLTEIAAGNGGTSKVVGTDVVFTASGGTIGPFRYAVLYDDTVASPADPLVAFWDYGSSVTLNSGETFTVDFDATNGIFQIT